VTGAKALALAAVLRYEANGGEDGLGQGGAAVETRCPPWLQSC
jgi:hypothetical protein